MRPFYVFLLVVGAIGGALVLLSQMVDVRIQTAAMQNDVKDVKERLARLEMSLAALRRGQEQAQTVLERVEGKLSNRDEPPVEVGAIRIDGGEAELIRNTVFEDPSARPEMNVGARVGAAVQDVSPRPMPVALVSRFPKLRGLRYVIDSNWAIALIAPKADRVVAVIPPI